MLKNFQMECMRENSWIEMALTAYETDGLSYEKCCDQGISELTHTDLSRWQRPGCVKHVGSCAASSSWDLKYVPLHRQQGWYDRQSKQRRFYIMKMVMRQMVYSNTAIISAFLFSFPHVYISPSVLLNYNEENSRYYIRLNCEIANIWQLLDQ